MNNYFIKQAAFMSLTVVFFCLSFLISDQAMYSDQDILIRGVAFLLGVWIMSSIMFIIGSLIGRRQVRQKFPDIMPGTLMRQTESDPFDTMDKIKILDIKQSSKGEWYVEYCALVPDNTDDHTYTHTLGEPVSAKLDKSFRQYYEVFDGAEIQICRRY